MNKFPFEPTASRVIVQFTPLPIDADSRTFKQAASLARAGYRSIVVEGVRSTSSHVSDFELISPIVMQHATSRISSEDSMDGPEAIWPLLRRSVVSYLRKLRLGALVDIVLFLLFKGRYWGLQSTDRWPAIPAADIYVVHSVVNYKTGEKLAQKYGAALVYDAHDAYAEVSPDENIASVDRKWIKPFFERIERQCVRRADAFFTVSNGVARLIEGRFGRRPIVIRNVHDPRLDQPIEASIRQATGVSTSDFLIVGVGNYKHGSSIGPMLKALDSCDERVHLAFLGRGYEEIASQVRSSPVSSRVHLLAPVNPDEVVPFIRDADASVILYYALTANFEYALPNRFFQTIAAKLPLICPDLTEMRRIVEEEGNGVIVDTRNSSAIAEAVRKISGDRAVFDRLKANAVRVAGGFVWECEERMFLDVVNGLSDHPSSRRDSEV